jgi:hypothetical protein
MGQGREKMPELPYKVTQKGAEQGITPILHTTILHDIEGSYLPSIKKFTIMREK